MALNSAPFKMAASASQSLTLPSLIALSRRIDKTVICDHVSVIDACKVRLIIGLENV